MDSPIILAILGWTVCLGGVSPNNPTDWTMTYFDNVVQTYHTEINNTYLCFQPRLGRRFSYHACAGTTCSPESYAMVVQPIPGDTNYDCVVGGPDYQLVAGNWGETCEYEP